MKIKDIRDKVSSNFKDSELIFSKGVSDDIDLSQIHHLELTIISDDFLGMNQVARNRKVFSILKEEIKDIHAISLKLLVRSE